MYHHLSDLIRFSSQFRTNTGITEQLSPPPSPSLSAVDIFRPSRCSFNETDSVLLPVSSVTTYLDRALFALGLDTEARTSFITYVFSIIG